MTKASELRDVFARMGITLSDVLPETIYPFSPVFKAKFNSNYIIVKRTRSPLSQAENLLKWTANLARSGVNVVLPVAEIDPNPVFVNNDVWVAYPFISGRPYHGTSEDIIAAGRLLGQIHAAPIPNTFELYQFSWPDYDDASIQEDIDGITNRIEEQGFSNGAELIAYFCEQLHCFRDRTLPKLKNANLPYVNGTWDYKANNLIYDLNYKLDGTPVLIDPDSAGKLPRILDLALAVLLFHNELSTAPGRLFSVEEWNHFKSGYLEYVSLTDTEYGLWETALRYMLLEEGLWLLINVDEDWERSHQRQFLISLLNTNVQNFSW